MKFKKLFKNVRVATLLIFLALSLITIFSIDPGNWTSEGVAIRAIDFNSSAANAGMENPASTVQPLDREVIKKVDGKKISNVEDYYSTVENLGEGLTIRLTTDKTEYILTTEQVNEKVLLISV